MSTTQLVGSSPAAVGAKRKQLAPTLWVAAEAPPLPPVLTERDYLECTLAQRRDYFDLLVRSCTYRMTVQLALPKAKGGIDLQVPLHEVELPKIHKNSGKDDTTSTFRETWDNANAKIALETTQLYESAGSVYWFDLSQRSWEGKDVCWEVSMAQYQAAVGAWSKDVLLASSKDARLRRYVFDGTYPTAIPSLGSLAQGKGDAKSPTFQALPLLAGHNLVLGFYGACDECLREHDWARLLKLYEASVSLVIRMRLAPDFGNVVLDSLRWSEQIKMQAAAGADTFLQFVSKATTHPKIRAASNKIQTLQDALKEEGVFYGGKAINRSTTACIYAVAPFAAAEAVREAVEACDAATQPHGASINEMTKLSRMCALANTLAGAQSKLFLVYCAEAVRVGVEFKDLKVSELNVGFLTSQHSKRAAFVHLQSKRFEFDAWFRDAVATMAASVGREDIREGLEKVLQEMPSSPRAFAAKYASGAKPKAAAGAQDETTKADNNTTRAGLREATEAKYDSLRGMLRNTTPQLAADILYFTMTGQCDDEFMHLAQFDLEERSISFSDYVKQASDGGEIGALQRAYVAYTKSLIEKPTSVKDMGLDLGCVRPPLLHTLPSVTSESRCQHRAQPPPNPTTPPNPVTTTDPSNHTTTNTEPKHNRRSH